MSGGEAKGWSTRLIASRLLPDPHVVVHVVTFFSLVRLHNNVRQIQAQAERDRRFCGKTLSPIPNHRHTRPVQLHP